MPKLDKTELKLNILQKLIEGEQPDIIAKEFGLSINKVLSFLGDRDFAAKSLELFNNQARGLALIALHNISRIAFDETATQATQLKASKILADIARELNDLHSDDLEPSTMTQAQLAARLKAIQKEVNNRAKPIDTGVINISLEDMR